MGDIKRGLTNKKLARFYAYYADEIITQISYFTQVQVWHFIQTKNIEIFPPNHMDRIKRKSAFKHAQNVQIQIILRRCKVSFGYWLSIHTFCKQTVMVWSVSMRRLIWVFAVCIWPVCWVLFRSPSLKYF